MPCTPKRARLLLESGRAVVHRRVPFTIRLRDRAQATSVLQPVVLKLDPGSHTTGAALVREEQTGAEVIHHALHLAEISHRGTVVHIRMQKRALFRRRRRTKNLRHRQPRFANRHRPTGWLPPSLASRVGNIRSWAARWVRAAPIVRVDLELVRFDTQQLQNPEIAGIEYQRGALFGFEVWEYLLAKWGHQCAYCGRTDRPLVKEHIIPKSRGGSDRVSNLCPACIPCNERKNTRTAAEFGHPEVQARARAPLRDAAAMNITRYAVRTALRSLGLSVTTWTGGRTRWNRTRAGLPKTHALDALCVGAVTAVRCASQQVLGIKAMGRGQHVRTRVDRHGFPRGYLPRTKQLYGFATGDLVRAVVPQGKHAGTHLGRVVVRTTGQFHIGPRDGINWRYCTLLQRGDGYEYTLAVAPVTTRSTEKGEAGTPLG
jgi:5-methylcytosine-specific restriction endonuclease McrA